MKSGASSFDPKLRSPGDKGKNENPCFLAPGPGEGAPSSMPGEPVMACRRGTGLPPTVQNPGFATGRSSDISSGRGSILLNKSR
jgi:hypothetical protein